MKTAAFILTFCIPAFLITRGTYAGGLHQNVFSTLSGTTGEPSDLVSIADSTAFAKVVIYRPDNQLSRKYRITTDQHASFSLKKKEEMTLETQLNVLEVEVSVTAHKSERFRFVLSKDKVHYLRVQDRNNYSGMRPFLEIIEVNEATYIKDGMLVN